MTDIVERLRKEDDRFRNWHSKTVDDVGVFRDAADEIEQLRKQVAQERYDLRAVIDLCNASVQHKLDEILERIKKLGI